jgi:large subunit ribosomal protein L21
MKAVILTGGKQYVVSKGDKIHIEKLEKQVGDKVVFNDVLLTYDDKKVEIGKPNVSGATVEGEVKDQYKDDKVYILKHKRRKRYMRRQGHRQNLTVVEITKVA